jgi:hypothetical protein
MNPSEYFGVRSKAITFRFSFNNAAINIGKFVIMLDEERAD